MPRILACVAALAFVLAACGDDGGGSDPAAQPYIDAAVASIQEEDEGGFALDDENAECIARATIEGIGVDTLEENEITPEDIADAEEFTELGLEIDEETATAIGDRLNECDLAAALLGSMETQLGSTTEEERACIEENLQDADLGNVMANAILGEESETEAADPVFAALAECPDAIASLMVQAMEDSAGEVLSEAAKTCIRDHIASVSDTVVEVMQGTGDEEAFEADLRAACGDLVPGGG